MDKKEFIEQLILFRALTGEDWTDLRYNLERLHDLTL